MKTNGKRIALSLLALSLSLGLAACGAKDEKKPVSQAAAKVNAEEISVYQVNFVLGRSGAGAIPSEQAAKVRREILDKLVDQQLAAEQAVEKKLDRSPEVLMAIDAARREILARAYIEQLAATVAKPAPDEVKKYYLDHPQLFAERRIYNVQELVAPASAGVAAQLKEMIAAGKPMTEIATWLKNKDIKFVAGSATRAAEQMPLDLLPQVHALKDGQGLVVDGVQNVTVMRVMASQSAPVAEAAALPRIEQFLGNQRAGEAAARELKQLKEKAKITYLGEFAAAEAGGAAPVATPTATPDQKPVSINKEKGAGG